MRLIAAGLIAIAAVAGPAPAEPRKLDMTTFFAGRTHSQNVLKIALKRPKRLIVDSVGKVDGKDLVLIDTVREEGEAVRIRKWVMRPAGPGRYAGTLTDAVGPVEVHVAGDAATIRYTMKGGLKVEQKLQLRADGKSLSNQTVAKKFGMKFARIEGTIRKLD